MSAVAASPIPSGSSRRRERKTSSSTRAMTTSATAKSTSRASFRALETPSITTGAPETT